MSGRAPAPCPASSMRAVLARALPERPLWKVPKSLDAILSATVREPGSQRPPGDDYRSRCRRTLTSRAVSTDQPTTPSTSAVTPAAL